MQDPVILSRSTIDRHSAPQKIRTKLGKFDGQTMRERARRRMSGELLRIDAMPNARAVD